MLILSSYLGEVYVLGFFKAIFWLFFFFIFFLDIPGHAWGGYPGSLDNKVILIYVSQQRFFK